MADFSAVAQNLRNKAKHNSYKYDPVAWASDELNVQLWSKQQEILNALVTHKNVAVKTTFSVGKDLPLDTPIPTPEGWTTMGDIVVGDKVLDHNGQPTTVTYVSPVMRTVNYRLTFGDGTTAIAGEDHQWNTLTTTKRRAIRDRKRLSNSDDWRDHWDATKTLTTKQIVDTLTISSGQANHAIPTVRPLDLPHNPDLVMPPYIFGAWLGDGTSISPGMTIGNEGQHIIDEFDSAGYSLRHTGTVERPYSYTYNHSAPRGVRMQELRALGVYGDKHIPVQYLRASEQQRRALLRGIMDTDGFSIRQGTVGIDLANKRLAYDVAELVRTLGYKVNIREGRMTCNRKPVEGVRYRLAWTMEQSPFTAGTAKDARYTRPTSAAMRRSTLRTIVHAEVVPTVPSRCISVDNGQRLYLATENMIPTHNTMSAAVASAWWVSTRGIDSLVFTTAPTFTQVKTLLWSELQRMHAKANLPGEITQDARWTMPMPGSRKSIEVAMGRKPVDGNDNQMHAMQGIHRTEGVLVIGDEADGIDRSIINGMERITTGPHDRTLLIGNPTDPSSRMAQIFKNKPDDWYLITISAFDTPNFTGEMVPEVLRKSMPQVEWVEKRRREWGEDSNRWISEVLAEYPTTADDGLFNMGLVQAAVNQIDITPVVGTPVTLGVDVANFGSDSTVVASYQEGKVQIVAEWKDSTLQDTATRVLDIAKELGANRVNVDAIGIGRGVFEPLVLAAPDYIEIYDMVGNRAAPDSVQHYNARAYWYDSLRKKIANEQIDLPDDDKLYDEFASVRFTTRNGAILIESKEDMRKRGIKSPDSLDAVVYACVNDDADQYAMTRDITIDDILEDEDYYDLDYVIAPY